MYARLYIYARLHIYARLRIAFFMSTFTNTRIRALPSASQTVRSLRCKLTTPALARLSICSADGLFINGFKKNKCRYGGACFFLHPLHYKRYLTEMLLDFLSNVIANHSG